MAAQKPQNPTVAEAVTACLAVLRISKRSKREYESALLGTEGRLVGKGAAGPALAKSHLGVLRVDRLTAPLLGLWFEQRFPESLAKSTRKKGMIALRHFVTFCISQDWAHPSLSQACRPMPSSEARRTWLHPEVVQAWGRIAREQLDGWRFFAWFVLLSTGARVSEAAHLRRSSLDPRTNELTLVGKYGKTRKVPVDDAFVAAWNAHVNRFAIAPDGWMFFYRSPRFTSQNTYEWVIDKNRPCGAKPFQRLCTMVQTEAERLLPLELTPNFKVTPHVLRRTFACLKLIENALGLGGMDIVTLQGVMGHQDLATTRDYLADVDSYLRSINRGDTNALDAADAIVRRRNELHNPTDPGN
ncbi:MAG TPA: site-specific integrase [Alphaproteobacteria bacterium]|nr:site-specific integrase [Alphaproteobacteria bacterium]